MDEVFDLPDVDAALPSTHRTTAAVYAEESIRAVGSGIAKTDVGDDFGASLRFDSSGEALLAC